MTHKNIEIIVLPILSDNYVFVIRNHSCQKTIVVDPGEARSALDYCEQKQWTIHSILLTHHHADHTAGTHEIVAHHGSQVVGPGYQPDRYPSLTLPVKDGDHIEVAGLNFEVLHLPGHTKDHIAYVCNKNGAVFSGDVLFGMGCGRLFEGSSQAMFTSLNRLKTLPPKTKIYCTHEYTERNGEFAVKILKDNEHVLERMEQVKHLRAAGDFTVPLTLEDELRTNPFLLAKDLEEFTRYREARNHF